MSQSCALIRVRHKFQLKYAGCFSFSHFSFSLLSFCVFVLRFSSLLPLCARLVAWWHGGDVADGKLLHVKWSMAHKMNAAHKTKLENKCCKVGVYHFFFYYFWWWGEGECYFHTPLLSRTLSILFLSLLLLLLSINAAAQRTHKKIIIQIRKNTTWQR